MWRMRASGCLICVALILVGSGCLPDHPPSYAPYGAVDVVDSLDVLVIELLVVDCVD